MAIKLLLKHKLRSELNINQKEKATTEGGQIAAGPSVCSGVEPLVAYTAAAPVSMGPPPEKELPNNVTSTDYDKAE
jgi:hypothetical protein